MFFGRETELQDLESLWRKSSASLVACRGRRRIGKSRLIGEFAMRSHGAYVELVGLPPRKGMSNADQLKAFAVGLSQSTGRKISVPENWAEAFERLDARKGVSVRPVLVFLGELDGNVEGDGFFDALIPAPTLLKIRMGPSA